MSYSTYDRRPTYEMLQEIPYQGEWSEGEYIAIESNKIIEFTDGFLEFLPMPTEIHLRIHEYILAAIRMVLARRAKGVLNFAPFKMKVDATRYREPDVLVLLDENDPRRGGRFWTGADFVVEIVCPDNPERDYWKKRVDYADARVTEYWIVDPQMLRVTQLHLVEKDYAVVGVWTPGDIITSKTLPELSVDVKLWFDEMKKAFTRDPA